MISYIVHDRDTDQEHSFECFQPEQQGEKLVEARMKLVKLASEGHTVYLTKESL
jgi:IMP dehydrogenase/GMP reductase